MKVDGKSLFPKPGTCINVIQECGQRAASSLGSSKPGEQNFSTPACFSKTKPRANWRTFLDFTRRNFWKGQDEFLERIAESKAHSKQLYKAAEALGRLNAWDKIFTRDAVKDDVMGEAYCQDGLPNYVKDGRDWPRTNHKGDSRTKRYTNPKPNSTDFKQREAKIWRACAKRGVPPPLFLSQQERRMGRTLCRSARAIRVRAGSKRSGAGTGPDVRHLQNDAQVPQRC